MCEIKITNVNPVDPTIEEVRLIDMAATATVENNAVSEGSKEPEPVMRLNEIHPLLTSSVQKFNFDLMSDIDGTSEWTIEGNYSLRNFMRWLKLVGVDYDDYFVCAVSFESKDTLFIAYENRSDYPDDVHSLSDYYFYGYKPWEDDMDLLETLSESMTAEDLRDLDRDDVEEIDVYTYEDLGKWILDEIYCEECPYELEDYVDWEAFCDNWLRYNSKYIYTGDALYRIE